MLDVTYVGSPEPCLGAWHYAFAFSVGLFALPHPFINVVVVQSPGSPSLGKTFWLNKAKSCSMHEIRPLRSGWSPLHRIPAPFHCVARPRAARRPRRDFAVLFLLARSVRRVARRKRTRVAATRSRSSADQNALPPASASSHSVTQMTTGGD